MDISIWIVIFVVLSVAVGVAVFYYRRRKNEVQQFFEQISESAKQVPQQKKPGFILLMLRESVRASKSKKADAPRRMNDPKQLEAQLVQMASILKDRSKVSDKDMKRTLQMYDSYMEWEKKKSSTANTNA